MSSKENTYIYIYIEWSFFVLHEMSGPLFWLKLNVFGSACLIQWSVQLWISSWSVKMQLVSEHKEQRKGKSQHIHDDNRKQRIPFARCWFRWRTTRCLHIFYTPSGLLLNAIKTQNMYLQGIDLEKGCSKLWLGHVSWRCSWIA